MEGHKSDTAFLHLLWLVSRGQALLAELFRLSDRIPPSFNVDADPKYAEVLTDYRYLKASEHYEEKIESDARLLDLDDEFRENHLSMLERFFQLFEGIVKYYNDLMRFLDDLKEGIYIQQTVDGVITDPEGKQLVIEAAYLHGVLMLLLDQRMDAGVKERIVVSYYRYKGAMDIPNIDDVIKLCRSTGYSPSGEKQTVGYPEQYIQRFPLPRKFMMMIVGRLRLDDVYNQIRHYPNPEHRSRALSQQASMLYVLLYFLPDVLHSEMSIMREVVDKHFVDNWVVPFAVGHTVDISVVWKGYPAAKAALDNVITPHNAKRLQAAAVEQLPELQAELTRYLNEGVLTEEFVLVKMDPILNCLRQCNVVLQWLLLHATTKNTKLREAMYAGAPPAGQVSSVLLDVSQLELEVSQTYKHLLDGKQQRWDESKKQATECIRELAEFFAGSKVLARKIKDDNLKGWFDGIEQEVVKLDFSEPVGAGRKIQHLITALEEVEQFHQFGSSLQSKQYLADTRDHLLWMVRTANISEDVLTTFSVVADASYAWGPIITGYTVQLHDRIKKDPFSTLKLRCLFLKLKSVLEIPLLRVIQSNSPDLMSVSQFYSTELINYVRQVMEIVPVSMFENLNAIIRVLTERLKELPTRLEKAQLRDYAQLDERYQLAQATYSISAFTQGILAMEKTLLGLISLDPKKLLEEGIRKQLVINICQICHKELVFTQKVEGMFSTRQVEMDFEERLKALAGKLAGFRRSFEYIQDYVNIHGLRVWQEEFQRIINYMVEQECNKFLTKKVADWQSKYQSVAIPIPRQAPVDDYSYNFMGRLTRELLRRTDPDKCTYLFPLSGWFDPEGKEIVGIRMFSLLKESVGVLGLTGIDKLLCFIMVYRTQQLLNHSRAQKTEAVWKGVVAAVERAVEPLGGIPERGAQMYEEAVKALAPLWKQFLSTLTFLGQGQLLRRQIAVEVSSTCKLDSNSLSCALETMNSALLKDLRAHYQAPDSKPYPGESPLLPECSKLLTNTGIHNPLAQIYITTEPFQQLPMLLFLFTIHELPKYSYNSNLSCLMPNGSKKTADVCTIVVGILTLLRQFHSTFTLTYIQYLAQYIRVQLTAASKDKSSTANSFTPELVTAIRFLEDFSRYGNIPREVLQMYVPPYVLDHRDGSKAGQ